MWAFYVLIFWMVLATVGSKAPWRGR
jgi:hypothetical protein